MRLSDEEREEIAAVRDSDGRGLPPEAIVASQQWLARRLIDADNEVRRLQSLLDRDAPQGAGYD